LGASRVSRPQRHANDDDRLARHAEGGEPGAKWAGCLAVTLRPWIDWGWPPPYSLKQIVFSLFCSPHIAVGHGTIGEAAAAARRSACAPGEEPHRHRPPIGNGGKPRGQCSARNIEDAGEACADTKRRQTARAMFRAEHWRDGQRARMKDTGPVASAPGDLGQR
jgi:hypothetical protein